MAAMIRFASLLVLGTISLAGCGDDDGPTTGIRCTSGSTSCSCTGEACRCISGEDCNVQCDDLSCGLTCTMDAKCEGHSTAVLTLVCSDTSQCKGQGGDMSFITCENDSNCDMKAGMRSTAVCRDNSTCKINLGANSNVLCEDAADCDIKCDANCVVQCAPGTMCDLTCGPDDAGVGGMECPDGSKRCGGECPT